MNSSYPRVSGEPGPGVDPSLDSLGILAYHALTF
jgi:hypothetical protein